MNETTPASSNSVSSIRPRIAFCLLAALHVTVVGAGLLPWPGTDYEQIAAWHFPLVLGGLAALVSLVTIWLALGRLALGRRLTVVFVTLLCVWLVVTLLLIGVIGTADRVDAPIVAMPVTTMFAVPGAIMYVIVSWLRRRYGWHFGAVGKIDGSPKSVTERQFSVRHIMLWTLLAALALGMLRAAMPDGDGAGYQADLLEILGVFLGFGVVHALVGLTAIFCGGLRPRIWTIALAVVLIATYTALSLAWIEWWGGANRQEVWGFSLPSVVHVLLFSASLVLLRLAGYHFTRQGDTPAEATDT